MGKKKSTTKTTQNTVGTNAPPSWTFPGLSTTAGMVTDALGQIPATHYSGPMVATMDPTALSAIQNAWGATAQNATNLAGWEQGNLGQLNEGMNFSTALPDTSYDVANRPDLTSVINASIDPVRRQLMETILPGIQNSALASGAYSSDRATGVMPQTAIRDAEENMQQIAAQLGYQDYNDYENRRLQAYQAETAAGQQNYALDTQRQNDSRALQLQALGMQPDMINSILHTQASSGDLMRMAAELGQQQNQLSINNATGMDQYQSQSPFMGLDTASELLARLSGNYGTQTQNMTGTQTTTQSGGLAGQLVQAALGAGMMAMGMPGGMGAIGGALGLGGGASSLAGGGATAGGLFDFLQNPAAIVRPS
jgi:lactam utilization protein B